jgi:hypothetical protein
MPINFSNILTEAERKSVNNFIDKGLERGVAPLVRQVKASLERRFPTGTVIYSDGSKHTLRSYSEMLVRTTLLDASREATIKFIESNPTDLVQVSIEGSNHLGCSIYEGETLSVSGTNPDYRSLESATGPGQLFHPNCVHSIFPVYNEGFDSTEEEREENLRVILENHIDSIGFFDTLREAEVYLKLIERRLSQQFLVELDRTVEGGTLRVGGSLALRSTGDRVEMRKRVVLLGRDEEADPELDRVTQ